MFVKKREGEGPYYPVLQSVLNVKVLEGIFNQEKALVGDFSVIVKSSRTLV